MRVAVLQSNYIPWKGYFDIIQRVDTFVFYDDVQFTKNDWRNRNRIKTPSGLQWLTIPVGSDLNRLVQDVAITDHHWQVKHWKTLQQVYGKAPFFPVYREFLEAVYLDRVWDNLSVLNQYLIVEISRLFLGVTTQFRRSSEFALRGAKSDRLLDLLQQLETSQYVSGPSALSYIDSASYSAAGITVEYMNYSGYPPYPQLHPPFEHGVSILDLLFHAGPEAPRYIWGDRHEEDRQLVPFLENGRDGVP